MVYKTGKTEHQLPTGGCCQWWDSASYDSNVHIETFNPALSKEIIDEINIALAKHYGFTAEELDFIINYDIKYRMGKELENGEEDE